MKKMLLLSCLLAVAGCGEQNEAETAIPEEIEEPAPPSLSIKEQKDKLYAGVDIGNPHYLSEVERAKPIWAGISHSSPSGYVNKDYFVELTDETDLQFIVDDMIIGSQRQPGSVAMSSPLYDMSVEYADGSTEDLHLWVSDDTVGTVMDALDTHYIYYFSDEASETFLDFVPEEEVISSPKVVDWVKKDTFGLTILIAPSLTDERYIIDSSDYIVKGSYLRNEPSDVPDSWGDESIAYYSFEVSDVLKGDIEPGVIQVGQTDYLTWWAKDPENGGDLGLVTLDNPLVSIAEPGKEVILFLSMQYEDGEFWRFSEPTMVEITDDGTLKSMAPAFDPEFDSSDRTETHMLRGWDAEFTIKIITDDFPVSDPFEGMTLEELTGQIRH